MLVTWIVPKPDPKLRLTLDQIDVDKLDFEDIAWICSSVMKQYRDEFNALDGFLDRSVHLIRENPEKMRSKRRVVRTKVVKGYPVRNKANDEIRNPSYDTSKTPTIFPNNPERFIEIDTQKSLPYNKIPFLKKSTRQRTRSCGIQ